jgi:hypothetical protein
LPFRFFSVTAIFARFRNNSSAVQGVNATAAYRSSSSVNSNISNYYFRISNSVYPAKPVQLINSYITGGGSEAQAELQKAWHSLTSSIGQPVIKSNEYNVVSNGTYQAAFPNGQWQTCYGYGNKFAGALDSHANGFSIGIELETLAQRKSDILISGINTNNAQTYFTANLYAAPGSNITVDFFAEYDMLLVISDGIMRTLQ